MTLPRIGNGFTAGFQENSSANEFSRAVRLTLEEFDRLFDEESTSAASPDSAFSRAELYCEHD